MSPTLRSVSLGQAGPGFIDVSNEAMPVTTARALMMRDVAATSFVKPCTTTAPHPRKASRNDDVTISRIRHR